jgi:hypothetical protein
VHASAVATFSASQDPRALIPLHGLLALRIGAISQQLLLLQLSWLPLGLAPILTPTQLSQNNSAHSKELSAVRFRTSILVKLVRRPTSTLLSLQVKLATTRLDLSRDSPPSNPQIPLASKSKMSTLMMTIFKMEEECFKEEWKKDLRKASTKLKMRERRVASKLNPNLLSLEIIRHFAEMDSKIMGPNLPKDLRLASLILQFLPLKSSREVTAISQSLLRKLDTSISQSLLLATWPLHLQEFFKKTSTPWASKLEVKTSQVLTASCSQHLFSSSHSLHSSDYESDFTYHGFRWWFLLWNLATTNL